MKTSNDFVRPVTHALGSKHELTPEQIQRVSGGGGTRQTRPTDTLCWDFIGAHRDIDD